MCVCCSAMLSLCMYIHIMCVCVFWGVCLCVCVCSATVGCQLTGLRMDTRNLVNAGDSISHAAEVGSCVFWLIVTGKWLLDPFPEHWNESSRDSVVSFILSVCNSLMNDLFSPTVCVCWLGFLSLCFYLCMCLCVCVCFCVGLCFYLCGFPRASVFVCSCVNCTFTLPLWKPFSNIQFK